MFGTLVVIKKNGEEGSKYPIIENQDYNIGPGFDCQLRFVIKDMKKCYTFCTLSTKNGMVKLRRRSKCAIFINDVALISNKNVTSGDVLKIGPKTFKWISNSETDSSTEPRSTNLTRLLRTLKGQRRGSTGVVQKAARRTSRFSTGGCISLEKAKGGTLVSSKDLKTKRFSAVNKVKKVPEKHLRNSTTGCFTSWEESNSPVSSSKTDLKMKQFTISVTKLKPSNLVVNGICSKSSSKSNSIKKVPSKIPKIFSRTPSKASVKDLKSCMIVEDKSPIGVGYEKKLLRNRDTPAKFSTSAFDVKSHLSSVSTTEISPDKLQPKTTFSQIKENVSLVEPRVSLIKLNTSQSFNNSAIDSVTNRLVKSNLRSSPKTPKKLVEDVKLLSAKKSAAKQSTPNLIKTVKTPDTSMNKPSSTPSIKAIKSANKRNASLEKSLDNKILAKKRKISNVMGFNTFNNSLHDVSNEKSCSVILSTRLSSQSYGTSKDISQKSTTFGMNVSGIDKLVHTPKDLRSSSNTSGSKSSLHNTSITEEHVTLFESPGKLVKNKGMSYSTPRSKSVSDWSVADVSVETSINIANNTKDRYVSETPEYNLSRDQTNAKTTRSSKNNVIENVFNETFDISAGRKSKTPRQNSTASDIFTDSPINTTSTSNKSLRSTSKKTSVIDRNVDMFPEQNFKTCQNILTVSLGTPISNDKMKRFSARLTNVTNLKDIKRFHKSPANDLTNVAGVKRLLRTPGPQQKSPKNELSDLRGVKRLLEPLRANKSPRNDLTNIAGIKALLKTPGRRQKEPINDLTNVAGVKQLLITPKRKQKEMEPKNDLTNVAGVKHLLKSPERKRKEIEPKNDLRNVFGVKTLMRSPRRKQKEPENNLTNVAGVKYLLGNPMKKEKESKPKNDLTDVFGVKKLLSSPRRPQNEPKNSLSDLRGVKRLMEPTKEPRNDLTDVDGVAEIMKSAELRSETLTDTTNLTNTDTNEHNISFEKNTSMDDIFDKLNDSIPESNFFQHRHALRTYERKGKSLSPVKSTHMDNKMQTRNSFRIIEKDTKSVDKWLEEHRKYQAIQMACVVLTETDLIEQTPVEEEPKPITRKRSHRVKTPLQDEPIPPVTRKRALRSRKEIEDPDALPTDDVPIILTRKKNLRGKKSEDFGPEPIIQPVTVQKNLRVKKIETEINETIEEIPTEVKPKRGGRAKAVETKVTRTKRIHEIAEETDVPAVKKRRTRKDDVTPVESESPDVKNAVAIKKSTRTMRNSAKPVVSSEAVEILEHNNLESLAVKSKAGRKRKVGFNVPEESPITEVKSNTNKAKKESPILLRRSGRNKK